jgi:hypothetical protein
MNFVARIVADIRSTPLFLPIMSFGLALRGLENDASLTSTQELFGILGMCLQEAPEQTQKRLVLITSIGHQQSYVELCLSMRCLNLRCKSPRNTLPKTDS